MQDIYDIIVVGAGPAGMTAALYARRAEKTVLLLEKENFGGQITFSPKVENYPGFMQMTGSEFADRLLEQVTSHGADIEMEEVTEVRPGENGLITVVTDRGKHLCRAVIIAAGSRHRRLGVPREEELTGNGVSYCAVCDGAFYAGRTAAVVGGGNTALQDAVILSDICKKVYILQNLKTLTGEERLAKLLRGRENVEMIFGVTVEELMGEGELTGVRIKDADTGEVREIATDAMFVAIGQEPENAPFAAVARIDGRGYISAGEDCRASDRGVFAAGDCRSKNVRQVATAVGDGAAAAVAACMYVDSLKRGE